MGKYPSGTGARSPGGTPPSAHRGKGRTWITDVTLISPEKLDQVGAGSLLVEDGRIKSVRRRGGVPRDSGRATVISGTGKFLIPGLIDSHVHLESVPGVGFDPASPSLGKRGRRMMREYFDQLPRSYLYYGYTTVVDLAVVNRQILEDFRHAPVHPEAYDCGRPLVVANGYPMALAPPSQRFELFSNFICDPEQATRLPPEYRPEEHTPAASVARAQSLGAICIKTFFERGFGSDRNLPVMGPGVFAEVRRATTRADLVLMMHGNSFEAQRFGVDGGVDVLVHGLWNWGDLDGRADLPRGIGKLLDRIAEKGIGYQPTIQVLQGLRAYFDPEYLTMDALPKVVPRSLLAWFRAPEGAWFKRELADAGASDSAMREAFDTGLLRRVRRVVGYLARQDANFLFGTDTPSSPTYGNLPGLNGYLEMQQLHRAGLSLAQILRAATINNARTLRLDSQRGTLETGKVADLLLLRRSPLESIEAYDTIETVWVRGTPLPRARLAADSNH